MRIRIAGLAGTAGVLAIAVIASTAGATFNGGNGPIAFESDRTGNNEIFTMTAAGGSQTNRSNNPASDTDPNWSQDRDRIAFVSNRNGDADIWVMFANGTGQTPVASATGSDIDPAFSPDNSTIVFASNRDGDYEIYTVPVGGGSVTKLTNNGVSDTEPDWAQTGGKIAFQRTTGGVGPGTGDEIFAMNADGSGQTNLTNNAGTISDRNPSWKPDGTRIAFESNRDGDYEIFRMQANGTSQTQLTNSSAADTQAAYSPDGTKIAFTTTRSGNSEIFAMAESGATPTNLTNNAGADSGASWQALDIFPPDTSITAGPADGTTVADASPAFEFTSTEAGSIFECRFDANAFANCSSPHTASPDLSEGAHTFEVRAIDPSGNVDPTPASRSFTVDTTADTVITSGPADGSAINTSQFAFEFTANESATFECRFTLNAGPPTDWTSCTSGETFGAPDGTLTFEVRATDAFGNLDPTPASRTFTIDTVAPETTIDTGPADGGYTTTATPTFTFSTNEPTDATFECSVDGSTFADCTSPFTTDPLSDGEHTFAVRASDRAGNTDATPASRTFTVDTMAPETNITDGPDEGSTIDDRTPDFEFNSDDPGATFTCQVDAGPTVPCTSPLTLAELDDGPHTLTVTATDPSGNADPTPATRNFIVNAPPRTAIDTGVADGGLTNDPTPEFTFSSDEDPDTTFECSVDGGPFTTCTSPFATDPLSDGSHTFSVRALDLASRPDPNPPTRTFTVDTTPPDTTITAPADGAATDATPTFEFDAPGETNETFECSIDGGGFTACSSPFTAPTLSSGSHTFAVRAIDAAGNPDPSPAERTVIVDDTPPDTQIDTGPGEGDTTGDPTPTFTFSSPDDANATFECSVDLGPFTACTSPFTTPELSSGPHTFAVRAVDAVGNPDPVAAVRHFTVDLGAPETTIDTGVADGGFTNDDTPQFTFSSEPGATFECSVDSAQFAACTSPFITDPLDDGSHTFAVRATDAVGNTDPTPASRTFTVDTDAPETTIDSGPDDPTNSTTANFTFSSDEDPNVTYTCTLDAGAPQPCTSPFQQALLAEATHTFEVFATDQAGNADPTPATYTWTIDLTEPTTALTVTPTDPTDDRTPTFEFNSPSDANATFVCTVDGGTAEPCTSPFTTDELDDGSHTFTVAAVDEAGNPDSTPASFTFDVDAAPRTQITAGPADGAFIDDPSPTFEFTSDEDPNATFECSVDGGTFTACTTPYTVSPDLGDGAHTFSVRALDATLRPDPTPPTRNFTVDTDLPDTTIDTGVAHNGTTGDPTPTFTFSSDEPTDATFECSVNGATYALCTSPFTTPVLSEGSNTFAVRAIDRAGNVDDSPASRTFTVDITAPETNFTDGPDDGATTNDNTPDYEFNSPDGTATFECSIDGAPFTSCASPFAPSALSDGSHTVAVRAKDAADNVDPSPAQRTVIIDTAAPAANITGGPTNAPPTNDNTPTFTFTSEAGATFKCSVDTPVPVTACTSPFTSSALGDGPHTFYVTATDTAGNPTTGSRSFTVDTAAPDTTITSGPAEGSTIAANTATFGFNSPDGGTTFQCSVDGVAFTGCTSPATTTALAAGAHNFRVRSTDAAGNTDASPATRTFIVPAAQTPPQPQPVVKLATSPGGNVKAKGGKVTLTLSCPADATTDCTGTVSLGKKGKGSAPYSIKPGQSSQVTLKLSKKAKGKLGKTGSAKLTLTITGSNGQTATVTYTAKQGSSGRTK